MLTFQLTHKAAVYRKMPSLQRVAPLFMVIAIYTILRVGHRVTFRLTFVRSLSKLQAHHIPDRQCTFILKKEKTKGNRSSDITVEPAWLQFLNDTDNGFNQTADYGPLYLTAKGRGRLGNHMFIYASLYGMAWRNQRIPLWWDANLLQLRHTFRLRIPADHRGAVSNLNNFTVISETGVGIYDNRTEQLPAENVMLSGFLQSWRNFVHVEDQLRHDFTFHPDVLARVRHILDTHVPPTWRKKSFTRVVIHVRRGDYMLPMYERRGWQRPEQNYFNRSMSYFSDCLPRVQFIVISDDLSWCRQNIVGSDIVFLDDVTTPVESLAVASLCDHAIITIGTFGWWAAWLANGVTIAQRNFPSGELRRIYSRDDYYKPDWITF